MSLSIFSKHLPKGKIFQGWMTGVKQKIDRLGNQASSHPFAKHIATRFMGGEKILLHSGEFYKHQQRFSLVDFTDELMTASFAVASHQLEELIEKKPELNTLLNGFAKTLNISPENKHELLLAALKRAPSSFKVGDVTIGKTKQPLYASPLSTSFFRDPQNPEQEYKATYGQNVQAVAF